MPVNTEFGVAVAKETVCAVVALLTATTYSLRLLSRAIREAAKTPWPSAA